MILQIALSLSLLFNGVAEFSTPAPCVSGQDEPVIAVYVAESDDWFYFDDARFVSGVDGCHYQIRIKPQTYRMCLAWPDLAISGVWLQGFDDNSELWCWQRPTHSMWLPSV